MVRQGSRHWTVLPAGLLLCCACCAACAACAACLCCGATPTVPPRWCTARLGWLRRLRGQGPASPGQTPGCPGMVSVSCWPPKPPVKCLQGSIEAWSPGGRLPTGLAPARGWALQCTCLGALVCVTGHGPELQLGMSPGGRQDWGKRGRVCGALATALLAAIPPRHPLNSWSHQQLARSSSAAQRAPPCLLDRMHGHPPRLADGVPAPSLFVASCHQQPDVPAPAPGRPLHRRRTNALKLQRVVGSRC